VITALLSTKKLERAIVNYCERNGVPLAFDSLLLFDDNRSKHKLLTLIMLQPKM